MWDNVGITQFFLTSAEESSASRSLPLPLEELEINAKNEETTVTALNGLKRNNYLNFLHIRVDFQ
jgi:hypothetical protein